MLNEFTKQICQVTDSGNESEEATTNINVNKQHNVTRKCAKMRHSRKTKKKSL